MKTEIVWFLLLALAVMAVLGVLRVPFARRFWVQARRFGYLYVGLIVTLAAISLAFGLRL